MRQRAVKTTHVGTRIRVPAQTLAAELICGGLVVPHTYMTPPMCLLALGTTTGIAIRIMVVTTWTATARRRSLAAWRLAVSIATRLRGAPALRTSPAPPSAGGCTPAPSPSATRIRITGSTLAALRRHPPVMAIGRRVSQNAFSPPSICKPDLGY